MNSIPCSPIDRSFGQKINRVTSELIDIDVIQQMNLTDIYRNSNNPKEHTFH